MFVFPEALSKIILARLTSPAGRDRELARLSSCSRCSGHEGKSYVLTGPEALTYYEVAEKLSAALGKTVSYVDVPLETARKTMLDSGAPDWFVDGQMEQFQVRLKGFQSEVTSVISEVAKKQPISFAQFARDYASQFRGEQAQPKVAAN